MSFLVAARRKYNYKVIAVAFEDKYEKRKVGKRTQCCLGWKARLRVGVAEQFARMPSLDLSK